MGKTHKKAVLLAVLAAAALAGTVFALFPAWEQHRCEEKQEAVDGGNRKKGGARPWQS